jgi:hypothetical protein
MATWQWAVMQMAVSTSPNMQTELQQGAGMELALKGDDAVPTRFEH